MPTSDSSGKKESNDGFAFEALRGGKRKDVGEPGVTVAEAALAVRVGTVRKRRKPWEIPRERAPNPTMPASPRLFAPMLP